MKIKAVCELTGLTDRAIRHYIEEELLTRVEITEDYSVADLAAFGRTPPLRSVLRPNALSSLQNFFLFFLVSHH